MSGISLCIGDIEVIVWPLLLRNPHNERDGHIKREVELKHFNRVSESQSRGQLVLLGRIWEVDVEDGTLSWIL